MNSRYGLCLISVCWIGLAGCANWQNRAGTAGGPGSAASLQPGGPVIANAPGVPPGTVFSTEPPPPVPPSPSDPNAVLAPLGSPQKLDLSEPPPPMSAAPVRSEGAVPKKMYNLDSAPSRTTSAAPKKSSTISRLASKAEGDSSSKPSSSELSTVKKLSQNASASKTNEMPSTAEVDSAPVASAPVEKATAPEPALPAPSRPVEPAPAAQAKTEAAPAVVDTTLLAQPVRKGSGSDKKEADKDSKGPQSSLSPRSKLFHEQYKPVIYPVSNPVAERPVDIIQFS